MFVYSMRATTVRFFAVVAVSLLALVMLVAFVPQLQPVAAAGEVEESAISYENVRTHEERAAFLAQFGWEVDPTPTASEHVTIPTEFDKVFAAYNELQKEQGLNLLKFKNKEVTRYTFSITNYADYQGSKL